MTTSPSLVSVSPEEREIMEKAFELFDKNNDGHIDSSEFGSLIRAIGFNASNHQIETTLSKYDKNNDGVIDFGEFVLMAKAMPEGLGKDKMEENLRQAFR